VSEFSNRIRGLAQAIARSEANAEDAIRMAIAAARADNDFGTYAVELAEQAVKGMVYDARHAHNVQLRKAASQHAAATRSGNTAAVQAVQAVCKSALRSYSIGGVSIALLTGRQLPGLIAAEEARADGHLFNARLMRRLQPLVGDDAPIGSVLSEEQFSLILIEESAKGEQGSGGVYAA